MTTVKQITNCNLEKRIIEFSKQFIEKLITYTEGFFDSVKFEKLLSTFEKELNKYCYDKTTESNLLRIFNSLFDKVSFFNDCINYPHHAEIVYAIAASSNYLTDIIVRNPEYLYQLFDQSYLNSQLEENSLLNEIAEGLGKYKSLEVKLNLLRQVKKRYILRIGLADILGIKGLEETIAQLSILAKAINKILFDLCYTETLKKYKVELDEEKYCLVSLGKLGGNEINYSSDVDLILFYEDDFYPKISLAKSYSEILSEAALLFIKSSTEISERGYIYRVDFRLRPDGKNSPICQSLSDYLRYYETRGEDWERQMLIKANFVCGSQILFEKFKNYLTPFIFPSSFIVSPKEQIRKLKYNIEQNLSEKENVKLFSGGIRDIEFSVQFLQLLNGGRNPELRTGNTLKAVNLLSQLKLLSDEETSQLTGSYIFYRKIEHFLQLMNDTQTHTIPKNKEILCKLINYLGLADENEFYYLVEKNRKEVKKIYESILSEDKLDLERIDWGKIKFANLKTALRNLSFLQTGVGLLEKKEFDSRTIDLFNKISKTLFRFLEKSVNPDKTLDNLTKIIRTTTFPSLWYNEMTNNTFFKNVLKICERNQKAIDLLFTDKNLGEHILTHFVFIKKIENHFSYLTIRQLIFILSIQYSMNLINHRKVSKYLTEFLRMIIINKSSELSLKDEYFIAGLGSFGTGELTFNSDIDLIIVNKNEDLLSEANKVFQKFSQDIKIQLSPFQVDFRLRPEGKSSYIVWDINNYIDYINKRARVWEFQALSKIKFICGNKRLYNKFIKYINEKVREIPVDILSKEIKEMHERAESNFQSVLKSSFNLKKGRGGLLTIDFILSFLLLKTHHNLNKSFGLSTVKRIRLFTKELPYEAGSKILLSNFNLFKNILLANQNLFNSSSQNIPADKLQKKELYSFLHFKNENEFEEALNKAIKTTMDIFAQVVK
ncbi:hypothetical protein ABRY23_06145 [Melioribacteraceae bacterium 4301-Me]|uniref:[protein-PII] uridylyltransferase family protein n=1 Tax=Pyranulibacter aquaticus TaxID=3163344 RepID=UPI0035956190